MAKPTVTESEILDDVIASGSGDLSIEEAELLLKWKFTKRAVSRIDDLAELNRQGTITAHERLELEKYLRVGSLLNLLHAKARLSLTSADLSRQ